MNKFFSRTHLPVMAAALLAAGLAGCEQTREAIGLEKQVPDEFAVVTRAPLSIPPDFRLRVPVPGAPRPQEATTRDKARGYLVGPAARNGQAAPPPRGVSTGEAALLKRAGALSPDPSIREAVDRESTALADAEKSVFDKVVFWRRPPLPGSAVDPDKESRRLREATALGEEPAKGDVPVIERKERGFLEGIF